MHSSNMTITDFLYRHNFYRTGSFLLLIDPDGFRQSINAFLRYDNVNI